MVNAVVLLDMERDRINEVAERLVEMDGVTEVYSVAGQHDLVVMIRARDNQQVADLVTGQMLKLEGIRRSETLIAFRVFSRYDLDRILSLGLQEARPRRPRRGRSGRRRG
jgi:DNA-binding Lrp family transcriptional regulator